MKKFVLFFGCFLLAAMINAQVPQGFKYQAVARDSDGDPIVNHPISVKISILSGNASGSVVYSELHEPTTNNMGLFDLEIGNPGLVLMGSFSEIDWGSATHFLKLEIDENGGLSFHLMGISQLLSVPYALYAKEAGNSETFIAGNGININGTVISNTAPDQTVSIAGETGITTGGTYPNFSVTNSAPDQTVNISAGTGISKSGTYPNFNIANSLPDQTVTITPGIGITKSGTYPNFTIANSLPDKTVILQGTGAATITGTYPNFIVNSNPSDTSATNEIQQLSKDGNLVSLSKNGGSFTDENTTYAAGTGLQLTGTTFSNTAPDQTVSITAGTGIIKSGAYPNFSISNAAPDQTVTINAGTGLIKSGNYPNFTLANSLPDQVVTIGGTGAASVTGTYPNFSVNANSSDTSATNELQHISKEEGIVTLSNNGGSFIDENTTYLPGTGLSLSGTTFNSVWTENNGNISTNNTGSVGIGTSNPSTSSKLEVNSTSGGFLPPRMTNDEMYAIQNPVEGLMIYNLTSKSFCFYNGDFWVCSGTDEHKNCGEVTYEGQLYHTVIIGSQCWMSENLNVGTRINGSSNQSNNGVIEKYCYNNGDDNCDAYGGLYQWNEMMNYSIVAGVQGICPVGWHLPTRSEWSTLIGYLDGEDIAGGKMKSLGGWDSPNTGATNSSGFSALPGGFRSTSGNFSGSTERGDFWSSTEDSSPNTDAYFYHLDYNNENIVDVSNNKYIGNSVRCIKDN